MNKLIPCLLLAASLAGCSNKGEAPGTAGGGGSGGGSSAGATTEVTFKTKDGWTIHGDFYQPAGATGAVVLLHQRGGSAADWKPLVFKLKAVKVSALAI